MTAPNERVFVNVGGVCIGMLEPSTIRTGYWCPTCLLPSAVEVDVLMLGESGVSGPLGQVRLCAQCGREEFD